jgi:hypothetical protein
MARARHLVAAGAAALLGIAALAPAAQAGRYDIHVYRITNVALDGRVDFRVDATGAGLDETLTRTAKFRGAPTGPFRIGATGRNVAFFREGVLRAGTVQTGPLRTAFTQAGSWSETRERTEYDQNDNSRTVIEPVGQGTCADSRIARPSINGQFTTRAGRLRGNFVLPEYPDFRRCPRDPDYRNTLLVATQSTVPRSRAYSAAVLTFPIRYRKVTSGREDGATTAQTVSWTGSITIRRVKKCVFRRGGNQFGCVRSNVDAL